MLLGRLLRLTLGCGCRLVRVTLGRAGRSVLLRCGPVIWGLLAFLLNFIPNLGSIIAAVPPVLLGYIQFGIGRALLVAAGFGVVNLVFGNVVEPKLMGRKLGLSTLVVFLSLVFWGWVWGPVGMLLSVPMTMVVKIALESSPSTHWISVLLDSEASLTHSVGNKA
ncbi:MAG: AI-2E family transporter [Nitrospirales bacterium]